MAFHRFLLWELIFGRPGLGRSTPSNSIFTRFLLWELIFGRSGLDISTPITPQWFHRFLLWDCSYLADQVLADLPLSNGNFTDSSSENSYLADQVLAYLPSPHQWFHRFLLWEFIFGRPGLGRSTPLECSFYRFLLWEFIFGQPGLGRSTLLSLSQMTISQIPTLRAHIWHTRS